MPLHYMVPLSDQRLAGHTTSPTTVDWNGDGHRELLIGGEDGHLYYTHPGEISVHFLIGPLF